MTVSRVCVLLAMTSLAATPQSKEGTIMVELRPSKSFASQCNKMGAQNYVVEVGVGFSTNPSVELKRVNASCAAHEVTFSMPDGDYHVFAHPRLDGQMPSDPWHAGIKPAGKYGVKVRAGQTTRVILHLEPQKGTSSFP